MGASLCTPTVTKVFFWSILYHILFVRQWVFLEISDCRWEIFHFISNFWWPYFALPLLLQNSIFPPFHLSLLIHAPQTPTFKYSFFRIWNFTDFFSLFGCLRVRSSGGWYNYQLHVAAISFRYVGKFDKRWRYYSAHIWTKVAQIYAGNQKIQNTSMWRILKSFY